MGDPMQSIYGFREAEVGLFLRLQQEAQGESTGSGLSGLAHLDLRFLALTVNFRSTPALVEWFNATFPAAFPTVVDPLRGAVPFHSATAGRTAGVGPPVTLTLFEAWPGSASQRDLQEAEQVGRYVREAQHEAAAARRAAPSIAILVRARTHLPAILAQLRRDGVSYRAHKIAALLERPVVQDLLALTRALLHPADRIAWLAVLRAPWCGLTLADLAALCADETPVTLWGELHTERRLITLSMDGQTRAGDLCRRLTPAVKDAGRVPLRPLVESAWLALGGPACSNQVGGGLEDAAAFFARLEQVTAGSAQLDVAGFEQSLETLHAAADVDGSVQILTMHEAKGLEFDVVIVPGLGRSSRGETSQLLLWLERDASPQGLLLAPVKAACEAADATYDYLQQIRRARAGFESTRLLYVAATRARDRLHLLGHVADRDGGGVPDARSLLRAIWATASASLQDAVRLERARPDEVQRPASGLQRVAPDWQVPAPPAAVAWTAPAPPGGEHAGLSYRWVGEVQRHVGTVTHAALLRLATVAPAGRAAVADDAAAIRAALRAAGVPAPQHDAAVVKVQDALRRTLADERGRWILAAHEEAADEFELVGPLAGSVRHLKLDRTFVEDGVRWIIDYKISPHAGGDREAFLDQELARHREQLETYAQLMARRDPRPIRLGLYFPLLGGWREWSGGLARGMGVA